MVESNQMKEALMPTQLLPVGEVTAKHLDQLAGNVQEAAVAGALEPIREALRQLRQQGCRRLAYQHRATQSNHGTTVSGPGS